MNFDFQISWLCCVLISHQLDIIILQQQACLFFNLFPFQKYIFVVDLLLSYDVCIISLALWHLLNNNIMFNICQTSYAIASALNVVRTSHSYGDIMLLEKALQAKKVCKSWVMFNVCIICLETFEPKTQVQYIPCIHRFEILLTGRCSLFFFFFFFSLPHSRTCCIVNLAQEFWVP